MCKITIIIPVYRVEIYLRQCVDSILAQVFSDWECILVDDGSPDESGAICDEYAEKDARVKVFHVANGGPSRARNIGLEHASGEWVMFVDADDWIECNALSTIVNYNERYRQPDLLFWGYNKVLGKTATECIPNSFFSFGSITEIDNILFYLFNHSNAYFGFSVNKLFKISIIKEHQIRFKENLRIKEDEIFTLEYCNYINSITVIPEALYNYRIISYSLSHNSHTRANYHCIAKYTYRIINRCPFMKFKKSFCNRIFDYYYNSLFEMLKYRNGSPLQSSETLLNYYRSLGTDITTAPRWFLILFNILKTPFDRYFLVAIIYLKYKCKR